VSDRRLVVTPEQVVRQALEHLSPWPPEHIVKSMRAWLPEALAELDELRADLKDASGELLVPIPDPGTYMAKLMIANRLLSRERDALRNKVITLKNALQPLNVEMEFHGAKNGGMGSLLVYRDEIEEAKAALEDGE